MPATLEPAAAAPTGVNIIDPGPPKPPPAPTRTIRLSEMGSPGGAPADDKGPGQPEPKRGSAMDRLQSDLRKKAGVAEPTPEPAKESSAGSPPTEVTKPPPAPDPGSSPEPGSQAADPKPVAADPKTGKVNPWKLVDEYKAKTATLEKENLDLKNRVTPDADRKAFEERVTKAEARAKELEDEIRFVNYEKSEQFQKEHVQPYERQWAIAAQELREISVVDQQTGQPRAAHPADLMELIHLPLGDAKALAKQRFPDFYEEMMAHRNTLKTMLANKDAALKEVKESGALREKQQRELTERTVKQVTDYVAQTWERVNKEALEDTKYGSYFKPKEGNQEWNQRLGKGFQLVDQAYSENPSDPRLTMEQRAAIVKRHAAVRNRAASWGAVRFENEQLSTRVAELEKELAEYKKSTPNPVGDTPSGEVEPSSGKGMDRVIGALRKLAK